MTVRCQVVEDESWQHRPGRSDHARLDVRKGNGGAGDRDPGSELGGDLYGEQAWTAHVLALVDGDRRGRRHQAQLAQIATQRRGRRTGRGVLDNTTGWERVARVEYQRGLAVDQA